VDESTASGKLTLNVFMAVAQFEREIMPKREGVAKAKAVGKYKGREPTARAKAAEIRHLAEQGLCASATPGSSPLAAPLCTACLDIDLIQGR
jgi:DNA invertase Pin-like site-specific DNA recombinase